MASFRFWSAAILTTFVVLLGGCSSDASSDDDGAEGALTSEPKGFTFTVNSPKERAGEVDLGNAYAAAWLSKMSYDYGDDDSIRKALTDRGIAVQEVMAFHAGWNGKPLEAALVTGTDGFYFRTKEAGFLVFRGSEEKAISDAIADIRFFQIDAGPNANRAGKGEIHAGFYHGLEAVWNPLRDILKDRHQNSKLPLYIMGHSLGGGLGIVALHHLLFDRCLTSLLSHIDVISACAREYIPVTALYTFGAPRTGDEDFATELAKRVGETGTKVFRFVNEGDQVSTLPRYNPIAVVEPYRHIGAKGDERQFAIWLDQAGKLQTKPTSHCSTEKDLVQCDVTIEQLATQGRPPWKGEHSRMIYVEKLRALLTNTPPQLEKLRQM
jgi:hypothetical protein